MKTNAIKKYETIPDKNLANVMSGIVTVLPKAKPIFGLGMGLIDGYYIVNNIPDSKMEQVKNICKEYIGQPLENLDEITLQCVRELTLLPGVLTIQPSDIIFHKREKTELWSVPINYFVKLKKGKKPNQNTFEIYSTL